MLFDGKEMEECDEEDNEGTGAFPPHSGFNSGIKSDINRFDVIVVASGTRLL